MTDPLEQTQRLNTPAEDLVRELAKDLTNMLNVWKDPRLSVGTTLSRMASLAFAALDKVPK